VSADDKLISAINDKDLPAVAKHLQQSALRRQQIGPRASILLSDLIKQCVMKPVQRKRGRPSKRHDVSKFEKGNLLYLTYQAAKLMGEPTTAAVEDCAEKLGLSRSTAFEYLNDYKFTEACSKKFSEIFPE
jgi:hypothetical protein